MKNHSVEVRLLGQKVALKSQGDPDRVREVVDLVSERLKEAEARARGTMAPHHVALLAMLDLAEEYVSAKERFGRHQEQVQETSRGLSSWIKAEFS